MNGWQKSWWSVVCTLVMVSCWLCGCAPGVKQPRTTRAGKAELQPQQTIGSLTEVFAYEQIAVQGYGIVAGLAGTGSEQCPPQVREYLVKYIRRQAPGVDPEAFINRPDTAVVTISGFIPAGASRGDRFDVIVTAVAGSQTSSLSGGQLYTAELSAYGMPGPARVLARAQGPVFVDKLEAARDEKAGYVLAGGAVLDDYKIALTLLKPDFLAANTIRNRINERFGGNVARAVTPGLIYLQAPPHHKNHKDRFLNLVKATYLTSSPELDSQQASVLIKQLAVSADSTAAEAGLEAIGQASLARLAALLNSSYESVRLRAARCMLNIGDDRGLAVLQQVAAEDQPEHRIAAIQALAQAAPRQKAAPILRKSLRDQDFQVRMAAYEALLRLDDIAVRRRSVANRFFLDTVEQDGQKAIYVCRSGEPKVVLFGAPIFAEESFFLDYAAGGIILDSQAEQKIVKIIQRHPRLGRLLSVNSSLDLADIITSLCEEPPADRNQPAGLAVAYSDLAAILQQMCQKGAVKADFHAGPLPQTR